MSLWEYANPRKFTRTVELVLPWVSVFAAFLLIGGLVWGFFFTPDDYRQGSTVKIFYLHVPTATMSIGVWLMMLVASVIWLVRRHHVSALAAKAAAPVGIVFTLIALVTGAIWGQPMWGTWWAWDPRLTSFLIFFLFYLGYVALWQAIEDPDTAADLTSILCLVGTVFALLSRYASHFWNQGLHQGSTVFRVEEVTNSEAKETIDPIFYQPFLVAFLGFFLLFVALVLLRTRTAIYARQLQALEARERMEA